MREPVLIVLAAGMGSRYGGLKQIDPVDEEGHVILDFSVYDARRAGFKKVIFLIKREIEEAFVSHVGKRIEPFMEVAYAYQEVDMVPEGFSVPEGRKKPFGTGHALLCCKDLVDGPFAVINADDYYGVNAFAQIYDYLTTHEDDGLFRYMMVGFHIENTITEHGHVSRGVCEVDKNHYLSEINERVRVEKKNGGAAYTPDEGKTWIPIPEHTPVSMNCWGFTNSFLSVLESEFPAFLEKGLKEDPMGCEYFLPSVVESLLVSGRATVKVLESADKWYGVTYPEDKAEVRKAIQSMKSEGDADGIEPGKRYPRYLWK